MQVFQCNKCGGSGTVEFTKEFGGPICNDCLGNGYVTRIKLRTSIASILDRPSVYMGGPSHNSLKKANKILDFMAAEGIVFPEGENFLTKGRV